MKSLDENIAEAVERLTTKNPQKDEDYYRIWESWGMTKEEWYALPVNNKKAA